jgi:DNA-binding NarL/FixJ family response regulator
MAFHRSLQVLAAKLLVEFARRAPDLLAVGPRRAPAGGSDPGLTARQREALTLVAQGLGYKEVGDRLHLSPRTVKCHMAEILERLHLDNRTQVLAYAGRMSSQSGASNV